MIESSRRGAPRTLTFERTAGALLAALLLAAAPAAAQSDAQSDTPDSAARAGAAGELPTGEDIAQRINARNDGARFFGEIELELIDRRGARRVREVRTLRRDVPGERQALFVFDAPGELRGTGLLIYDYSERERDDDQWLYLPADRKVRRVVTGDRGGYFVGTDFTYEDMKNGSKVGLADYRWSTLRREQLDERDCFVVEATAIDAETAQELGYGRVQLWVDTELWMARRAQIWDPAGEPLKTVHTRDIRLVQDVWTAHEVEVENQQSGHRTRLLLRRADYGVETPDGLFSERALVRGLPKVP